MKTAATEKSRSITFVYDSSQFPDLILWSGGVTCRRHFAAFQRPTSRSYKMDLKTTVCWILVKRMSEISGLKSKQSSCGGNPGGISLSVMHLIPWFPSFLVTFHCNLILKFAPGKVEKKEMLPSRGLMTMCSVRQETSLGEQSSKIFFLPLISVRVSGGGSLVGFISSLAGRWRLSWHRAASVCAVVERYQNCFPCRFKVSFLPPAQRVAAINKKEQKKKNMPAKARALAFLFFHTLWCTTRGSLFMVTFFWFSWGWVKLHWRHFCAFQGILSLIEFLWCFR